jgi:hypothetical protein
LLSYKFQQVEDAVKEGKPCDIHQDPARIFSADESSLQFCSKTGKLSACEWKRNVYEVDRTLAKESITARSPSLLVE